MKTALYIRVSTQEQADTGDSLREQEETLTAYAKDHNLPVYGIYRDEGISGQKNDREALNRLMNDVRSGYIKLILFTKLDRWFRSMRHYLNTQAELEKYGVVWKAVSQDYYDTTTAYGKTFVNLTMTFAELEAQNTSDRIKATFASKEANGEVLSGKCPIGYRIENKHLVIDEATSDMAIDIFRHYDETNSLNDTIRFMRAKYDIRRTQAALKSMLKNEVYLGHRRENLQYCPPLIDEQLFLSVQTKLSHNIRSDAKRTYLFTGLIECAECQKNLISTLIRRKKGTKEYTYIAYKCRGRVIRECDNVKTATENTVERTLLNYISTQMPEVIVNKKKRAKTFDNQKQRDIISGKIKRLKELYIEGDIDKNTYEKKKRALETELFELIPEQETSIPSEIEQQILDGTFCQQYELMDRLGKRNVWHSIVKKITLDKHKNVRFYFY